MKKSIILFCSLMTLVLAGCGSKQVATSEKKVEKVESQALAERKPATRAWGEGTNFKQSVARAMAENQARGAFQRQIETKVRTGIEDVNQGDNLWGSDTHESEQATNQGSTLDYITTSVSKGTLNNTAVINTDTYRTKDGQYHVYVCIEYQGEVGEMAANMAQSYKNVVKQRVSDADHKKMEERARAFEERMNNLLNEENKEK